MSAKVLNFVGGGGSAGGLNYEVVGGTTQPTGSENLIWVNTSNEITSHIFSADAPSSPSEGMVWFKTSSSSVAAFNALEENTLMVYPDKCQQYVNSAWVEKTALSYLNGEWVEWVIPVTIYPGVSYNAYNWYFGPNIDTSKDKNVAPTVSNNGTTVRVSVSSSYDSNQGTYPRTSGVAVSQTAVDLTGHKKVLVTYENKSASGDVGFWVNTTNTGGAPGTSTGRLVYVTDTAGTAIIQPTDALSGAYYFGIGVRTVSGGSSSTCAVTVTSVVAK